MRGEAPAGSSRSLEPDPAGERAAPERVSEWIANGEAYGIEFASEQDEPLDDRGLVEAVVCLANGSGGVLLLGVESDGTVTGVRDRGPDGTDPATVQALIANSTYPPLSVAATVVPIGGAKVLAIEVPDSPHIVGTTFGTYVRRAITVDGRPTCVPYHPHEMLARAVEQAAADWAALRVAGAGIHDLDPEEFGRFRRLARRVGDSGNPLASLSDIDLAGALGLVRPPDEVTAGALLLFGQVEAIRRFVPTHQIVFQVWRGRDLEANERFFYPLLRAIEVIVERVGAGGGMVSPESRVSSAAVREALVNALIHRDYTRSAPVRVLAADDQIEVSSPGGFPVGVRPGTVLGAVAQPRSPLLASALARAGVAGGAGRGIAEIFAEQLKCGRPAPEYGRSSGDEVVVVLPAGAGNPRLARWVSEQESTLGRSLSLAELRVIAELSRSRRVAERRVADRRVADRPVEVERRRGERRSGEDRRRAGRQSGGRDRPVTAPELAALLQRTEAETNALLARMAGRGWLEARGDEKARTWHLSSAVYRAVQPPAGATEPRPRDPVQDERTVLQYVFAHGQVTAAQIAELCSLPGDQASRLLRRMASQGKLRRRGERLGAVYVRAPGAIR